MFNVRWTARAAADYGALKAAAEAAHAKRKRSGRKKSTKAEGLFRQVVKAVRLLCENPRHPGLQTHEYYSLDNPFDGSKKVFEAHAQQHTPGAYRIFWCYGPGRSEITILAITPHP